MASAPQGQPRAPALRAFLARSRDEGRQCLRPLVGQVIAVSAYLHRPWLVQSSLGGALTPPPRRSRPLDLPRLAIPTRVDSPRLKALRGCYLVQPPGEPSATGHAVALAVAHHSGTLCSGRWLWQAGLQVQGQWWRCEDPPDGNTQWVAEVEGHIRSELCLGAALKALHTWGCALHSYVYDAEAGAPREELRPAGYGWLGTTADCAAALAAGFSVVLAYPWAANGHVMVRRADAVGPRRDTANWALEVEPDVDAVAGWQCQAVSGWDARLVAGGALRLHSQYGPGQPDRWLRAAALDQWLAHDLAEAVAVWWPQPAKVGADGVHAEVTGAGHRRRSLGFGRRHVRGARVAGGGQGQRAERGEVQRQWLDGVPWAENAGWTSGRAGWGAVGGDVASGGEGGAENEDGEAGAGEAGDDDDDA